MANGRRDDWLTDAQGRALAGAQVYYCTQPANVSIVPPSPLASVFSNIAGTATTNPQITDGFGHATAYAENTLLYTIVYVHPLFGPNPVILTDQVFDSTAGTGGGGGGGGFTPFAEVPAGAIDGVNVTFTLSHTPVNLVFWVNFR